MVALLLALLVALAAPHSVVAAEFRGPMPATRYDVAEFVARLLARAERLPPAAVTRRVDLADVPKDRVDLVGPVVHFGYLQLVDGRFFGDQLITRFQMARIVVRLLSQLDVPTIHLDQPPYPADVPTSLAERDDILLVVSTGYLELEQNEFRGNAPLSRFALAAIGARMAERLGLPLRPFTETFDDVAGSDRAWRDIQICYRTGVMTVSPAAPLREYRAESVAPGPKSTDYPPVPDDIRTNDQAITRFHHDLRDLTQRHVVLRTDVVNLGNRFDLGEPSAPRFLDPLDEEWVSISTRLLELVTDLNGWLADRAVERKGPGLTDAQRRALRRINEQALALLRHMQESRWRIRDFYKRCNPAARRRKPKEPNVFRHDDSRYDVLSPGY